MDSQSYFEQLSKTIKGMPHRDLEKVAAILLRVYERQSTVFVFGNGGSAALASHFACDLTKGTVSAGRKRFRAVALTDNVALMTAWANDSKYEDIFAEQLANFAVPGDLAVAISASGNSPNVLKALKMAKHAGCLTAGLTGFSGGRVRALCDACIIVPSENMQIIEDLQLSVAHSLFTSVRACISMHSVSTGLRLVSRTAAK